MAGDFTEVDKESKGLVVFLGLPIRRTKEKLSWWRSREVTRLQMTEQRGRRDSFFFGKT